ncbi:MAG: protein translocase subunit SecD, partial [Pseudomonadota bacterium]
MLEFPLWKKVSLWAITLFAAAAALPSLLATGGLELPEDSALPQVNLGLDLAGGSHLLLEAKAEDVAANRLETLEEAVEEALEEATPEIEFGDMSRADGRLAFVLDSASDVDRARGELETIMAGTGLTSEWEFSVVDTQRVILT